ncbi:MAG: beta-propeller fold lactonase family protein [Erysipelotrichaceae bacterium]
MKILVGGYTSSKLGGIALIDSNLDYEKSTVAIVGNPSYLCVNKNEVYCVTKEGQRAGFNKYIYDGELLVKAGGNLHQSVAPCYITLINNEIYTCNYHEGTLTIYDSNFEIQNQIYEHGGKCHFIIFRDCLYYCFFLGSDKIHIFANHKILDKDIIFPKGSGPRHAVLHHKTNNMYIICECSNDIYRLDINNNLKLMCNATTDTEIESSSAAIRLSEDENYLYVSNRGEDTIAIYEITIDDLILKQMFKLPTKGPRDFQVVDNKIIIANQFSNCVSIYTLNNYLIDKLIKEVPSYKPTCVAILEK